jgi:hypothetical protein
MYTKLDEVMRRKHELLRCFSTKHLEMLIQLPISCVDNHFAVEIMLMIIVC